MQDFKVRFLSSVLLASVFITSCLSSKLETNRFSLIPSAKAADETPVNESENSNSLGQGIYQSVPLLKAKNIDPDDLIQADKMVNEWIKENKEPTKYDDRGKPVLQEVKLQHFGSYIPKSLRFIATMLDKSDFKVTIELVTKEQIEAELQNSEKESLLYIKTTSHQIAQQTQEDEREVFEKIKEETLVASKKARLYWLDLMGMPSGFTLWLKLKRSTKEKWMDAKTGFAQLPPGTAGFVASFYFRNPAEFHASRVVIPALTFATWVWINMYFTRWIGEFQSQGRDVKRIGESFPNMVYRVKKNFFNSNGQSPIEAPTPQMKVVKKPVFQRIAVYGRSVITNALIVASVKATTALFDGTDAVTWTANDGIIIMTNALWSLFSRYAFEEWLTSKQARTLKDGMVIQESGRHSPKTTQMIRFWFELFNGFAKWLNLFQVPHADFIFPAMGILGTLNTVYDNRYWAKDKLLMTKDWFLEKAFNRPKAECELLLSKAKEK